MIFLVKIVLVRNYSYNIRMDSLFFQYCPKIAVFSQDGSSVLLCRRKGEADYDGVFSFIGGKMEHKDLSIIDALSREKTEEVGELFRIKVLPHYSIDTFFVKKDGSRMILPHYYAVHQSGEINLSEEYDDYRWVPLNSLDEFEPKIENIAWIATLLSRAATIAEDEDFVAV
ncbi:TPA: hypothetical protein DDW69_04390 [candidate division CPR2 bacterium]|uniref:8-oxo-dGTP diphosphatase n=1 Tax=candidate division CPR2 bacterium GW2011_GWC1_41_48 TaxID=1618344 RepID=A0A0G0W8H8_UNCC2|nr:MAG: hypothetical protein UT47_C0002G0241 [candidate division CPR2 bacterium GW2011_GWC2_39_35]KKR27342.1 MAG: hypothetical protein UT59_C0060G0002 [candidate division CPR2 bacterium GW2011_GWD1_39_7]KKR29100.1 MAG: hypothetical protein UT60_C0007G0045 [candidate division CPR2 bacterium GW2011_GWD2_39_7]KKS09285.1 MAG: hypothetical protein UU65_C0002G0063 [candidate division CPR2 bacterium GW2011_GWC1_41_48]OGB70586.1 MAG: hypothetical protein A2Y26_04590 [candidate division CPR2 bacterium G